MDKCSACKANYGKFHEPGCDMEPCSQCKRQKIACDCEKQSDILIPVGWNPVHDSKLWKEFCVPIYKRQIGKLCYFAMEASELNTGIQGVPGCGICENSGMIKIHGGVKKPCICPNGRAFKNRGKSIIEEDENWFKMLDDIAKIAKDTPFLKKKRNKRKIRGKSN